MERVKQPNLRIGIAQQDGSILKDRLQRRGGVGVAGA